MHDDDKLPETTNRETSECKAQSNLEAEKNILKEVQPEKKIQDSAKKGKTSEILVNPTTERKKGLNFLNKFLHRSSGKTRGKFS